MDFKVKIIIVTYNGMKWLDKCLNSCKKYDTIVVDNNSSDGTTDFIIRKYPEVKLLCQNHNLGFGKANNLGISYAIETGVDYVFLLNQDAYLKKDVIDVLVKMHKSNTSYGVLSPMHLNGDENKLDKGFASYLFKNEDFIFHAVNGSLNSIYNLPFVNAASWLLPVSTIMTIGGFDPIFFHYGEDDNYCQRVRYHGLKIGVVPSVFICHDREFRKNKTEFKERLRRKEAQLYVKWADPNSLNYIEDVKKYFKGLRNRKIKSILKLDFGLFRECLTEKVLVKQVFVRVKKSIGINKVKGSHYIFIKSS